MVQHLGELRPVDLSVTMFAFALIDLWTALALAAKHKSVLSKTLFRGFLFNLVIIMLPYALHWASNQVTPDDASFDYIQVVSVFATTLYLCGVSGSIIANYSAAYPEGKNFVTRFAHKYLENEVSAKKKKHNIG